jgi:hypothetical protein
MALSLAVARKNEALDAIRDNANSGKLRVYNGTPPATADTALSSNTLLAEATMNATAFGAASGGVITANSITQDSSIDATGTASFFRIYESDGTTIFCQGTVATSAADMIVGTVSFVAAAIFTCSSLTITHP